MGSSTTAEGSTPALAQLVQHQEAVLLVAHHQRRLHRDLRIVGQPLQPRWRPAGTGCVLPDSTRNCLG
jgi:hypothetical protein